MLYFTQRRLGEFEIKYIFLNVKDKSFSLNNYECLSYTSLYLRGDKVMMVNFEMNLRLIGYYETKKQNCSFEKLLNFFLDKGNC